jgi:Ca-activated chloride channel family protein
MVCFMKAFRLLAVFTIASLIWAQGPPTQGSETVAKPKKKADDSSADPTPADNGKIPSQFNKKDVPQGVPVFSTDALTISVDVAVLDNKDHFIPKLPKSYFRILEDNTPQQIKSFSMGEAPMTIAMVIEFSALYQQYYAQGWFQTLSASYGFLQTLKPEDYVAVIAYDLKSEILSDFSINRQDAYEAMQRLRIPGFREACLFDALADTADRMQDIEGRKAIVLIASGVDTFSKLTFDKARKAIQNAGVPIYAIGLLQAARIISEGNMSPIQRMAFLQADNEMKTFATESGGMAFFPRFFQEMPEEFRTISEAMRNEYVLTYNPSNQARDGKFRKIKVEIVNPETNEPLPIKDEKGKPIKYKIVAKTGYTAPRKVE